MMSRLGAEKGAEISRADHTDSGNTKLQNGLHGHGNKKRGKLRTGTAHTRVLLKMPSVQSGVSKIASSILYLQRALPSPWMSLSACLLSESSNSIV